jgi:beta-glucanase (GH16 family)
MPLHRGLLCSLLVLCHVALQQRHGVAHGGWVDPDTRERDKTIRSFTDRHEHKLVFSDEFNVDGRTFHDGRDPRWTAMDKDDYTNYALHYYKADLVRTTRGVLNISTIVSDVSFNVNNPETPDIKRATKNYQSGMVNSWNKFCFTGGIVEISAKLPGKHNAGGLWPAMWLLGNLARATYVASSNNMWPWSYNECSKPLQRQQAVSACNEVPTLRPFPLVSYLFLSY